MMKDYTTGARPYDSATLIQYSDGSDPSLDLDTLELPIYDDHKIHTVLPDQTLQNIAWQYYGDSGLWYVIALANQIFDPFTEVNQGDKLIIPIYG